MNRSARQPLDIATANFSWRVRYHADLAEFHFGSGPYSLQENAGYFLNATGRVEALLQGGEKIGAWPSMQEFLVHEIARAESIFPDYEQRVEEVQQEAKLKTTKRRHRE